MDKYPERKPARLKEYNYSTAGYYYVTICAKNHECLFGKITPSPNIKIQLSEIGQIIDEHWRDIPNQYGNVEIDEFIIMPNHIHGIINIVGAGSPRPMSPCQKLPRTDNNDKLIGRGDLAPTLGNIIARFKYQTTKQINELQNIPGREIWQRSFYDHVIRKDESLDKIREYIINNPAKRHDVGAGFPRP